METINWDAERHNERVIDLTDSSVFMHEEGELRGGTPMVSVVVPFYNPDPGRLSRHLRSLSEYMSALNWRYEIIAVSDGSTNDSNTVVSGLNLSSIVLVSLERNRGKGFAIREGFKRSSGDLIAYIDGDGDIAPGVLIELLVAVNNSGARVGVGQKYYSSRWTPHLRLLMTTIYSWLVRSLFHFGIGDTQAGVKVFRKSDVSWVMDKLECCGFGIDVEILAMLRARESLGSIEVVTFEIAARRPTTVNLSRAIVVVMETIDIFRRTRRLHKALLVPTAPSVSNGSSELADRSVIGTEAS